MNRRELLQKAAEVIGAAGLVGTVKAIEEEPAPLCLAVYVDVHLTPEQVQNFYTSWERQFKGANMPPAVLLQKGMRLKAVCDQRFKESWPGTRVGVVRCDGSDLKVDEE